MVFPDPGLPRNTLLRGYSIGGCSRSRDQDIEALLSGHEANVPLEAAAGQGSDEDVVALVVVYSGLFVSLRCLTHTVV